MKDETRVQAEPTHSLSPFPDAANSSVPVIHLSAKRCLYAKSLVDTLLGQLRLHVSMPSGPVNPISTGTRGDRSSTICIHDLVLLDQDFVLASHGLNRLKHLRRRLRREAFDERVLMRDDATLKTESALWTRQHGQRAPYRFPDGLHGFLDHRVRGILWVADDNWRLRRGCHGQNGE